MIQSNVTVRIKIRSDHSLGVTLRDEDTCAAISAIVACNIPHLLNVGDKLKSLDETMEPRLAQLKELVGKKKIHEYVFERVVHLSMSECDLVLGDSTDQGFLVVQYNGSPTASPFIPGDTILMTINDIMMWPPPYSSVCMKDLMFNSRIGDPRGFCVVRELDLVSQQVGSQQAESQEIEMSSEVVTAICPVSHRRMKHPVRGDSCMHTKCIDKESYQSLIRLSRGSKYRCPVCTCVVIKFEKDSNFEYALSMHPQCDSFIVRFENDRRVYAPMETSTSGNNNQVFDLTEEENCELVEHSEFVVDEKETRLFPKLQSEEHSSWQYEQLTQSAFRDEILKLDFKFGENLAKNNKLDYIAFGPCNLVPSLGRLMVCGVSVLFPRKSPSRPDLIVMKKTVECLSSKKHALIESPVGKTVALLCASLAWQRRNDLDDWRDFNGMRRKIIFCTESTEKVYKALSSTSYRPLMSVLGNREQLCLDESFCAHSACDQSVFETNLLAKKLHAIARPSDTTKGNFDIEELVKFGTEYKCCPFYTSSYLAESAQIVIAPYNYILDPTTRKNVFGDESSVVIFDQAENLVSACLEIGSSEISIFSLMHMVRDICVLHSLPKVASDANCVLEVLNKIVNMLVEDSMSFSGSSDLTHMFFSGANIGADALQSAKVAAAVIATTLLTLKNIDSKYSKCIPRAKQAATFLGCLSRVMSHPDSYHIVGAMTPNTNQTTYASPCDHCSNMHGDYLGKVPGVEISLSILLMESSVIMDSVVGFSHSVLLASDSIFPFNTAELGFPFASMLGAELQLGPAIHKNQIYCGIVKKTLPQNDRTLNGTRSDVAYMEDVTRTILCIYREGMTASGGTIILFQNDSRISEFHDYCETSHMYDELQRIRGTLLFVPNGLEDLNEIQADFMTRVDEGESPILVAVCHDTKTLDFRNEYCRAVFCVGVPYPNKHSLHVAHKFQWSNMKHSMNPAYPDGNTWLSEMAFRRVNQVIGRVVSKRLGPRRDFGCVFLLDYEYGLVDSIKQLPNWIQPLVRDDGKEMTTKVREAVVVMNQLPISDSQSSQLSQLSRIDAEVGHSPSKRKFPV